jgi:hypothetical protein
MHAAASDRSKIVARNSVGETLRLLTASLTDQSPQCFGSFGLESSSHATILSVQLRGDLCELKRGEESDQPETSC